MSKQSPGRRKSSNRFWVSPFIGVLVLAALFGVYAWQSRTPAPTTTPSYLLGFTVSEVSGVTMTQGSTTLSLYPTANTPAAQAGSLWSIGSPTGEAADGSLVSSFVTSLATLTAVQTVVIQPTSGQLSAYGLAPATASVAISRGTLPTVTLEVGNASPLGTGYYAQVQGQTKVVLINSSLAQEISTDPALWLPPPSSSSSTTSGSSSASASSSASSSASGSNSSSAG